MNIVTKKISELKPYENNPKIHTDSQIDKIAKTKSPYLKRDYEKYLKKLEKQKSR